MGFHREPNIFVSQVHLKVTSLERSLVFYQEVIGLKVLNQTSQSAELTADGKTVLVVLEQPDQVIPKQGRTTGLYHYALLLPTRADLGRLLKHFLQVRYPLQGASDHLVSEAIYLADPDGNGIEVYADRNASEWKWHNGEVEMATVALDAESLMAEGEGKEWNGLPAETIMGHIHLHVSELTNTEEFYTKGLGFEVVTRYGGQALFISTGKYHHHIGLNTWNGVGAPAPAENSVGLKSYTMVYPSVKQREQVVEQLKQMGASVTQANGAFVTHDPSGNRILLVV